MHIKKLIPFLSVIVLCISSHGLHAAPVERTDVNNEIGYAEVVRAGDYVYISGNVGWGKMPDAVKISYDSLEKLLKAQGLTFKDVVKENVYTTNLDELKANYAVRNAYYNGVYPAATWVQVNRLFNPEFVIEVELIAYAPQKCCAADDSCCDRKKCAKAGK